MRNDGGRKVKKKAVSDRIRKLRVKAHKQANIAFPVHERPDVHAIIRDLNDDPCAPQDSIAHSLEFLCNTLRRYPSCLPLVKMRECLLLHREATTLVQDGRHSGEDRQVLLKLLNSGSVPLSSDPDMLLVTLRCLRRLLAPHHASPCSATAHDADQCIPSSAAQLPSPQQSQATMHLALTPVPPPQKSEGLSGGSSINTHYATEQGAQVPESVDGSESGVRTDHQRHPEPEASHGSILQPQCADVPVPEEGPMTDAEGIWHDPSVSGHSVPPPLDVSPLLTPPPYHFPQPSVSRASWCPTVPPHSVRARHLSLMLNRTPRPRQTLRPISLRGH